MSTKMAVITGATAGIGCAAALRLAADGYQVIITGRREERLLSLAKKITDLYKVEVLPLCFDVRNQAETEKYLGNLPKKWQAIDVLINNAGLAVGLNPIQTGIIEDWERMVDTNVKGLLFVTRAVVPYMVVRKKGQIINIGSIAGREVYGSGNVYCATKHAVDALTKGMRIDLVSQGIRVSQIAPGAVETEFSMVRFKGDNERARNVYKGFTPLSADDVVDVLMYVINTPAHINIADVLVLPSAQASSAITEKKI